MINQKTVKSKGQVGSWVFVCLCLTFANSSHSNKFKVELSRNSGGGAGTSAVSARQLKANRDCVENVHRFFSISQKSTVDNNVKTQLI